MARIQSDGNGRRKTHYGGGCAVLDALRQGGLSRLNPNGAKGAQRGGSPIQLGGSLAGKDSCDASSTTSRVACSSESCSRIAPIKSSNVSAPSCLAPLMKNVGVPCAPLRAALFRSACTRSR